MYKGVGIPYNLYFSLLNTWVNWLKSEIWLKNFLETLANLHNDVINKTMFPASRAEWQPNFRTNKATNELAANWIMVLDANKTADLSVVAVTVSPTN